MKATHLSGKWSGWALWLVPLICFLFGALCLLFVVGPGDGTWILYAREMASGKRIYSDLGLNQQPVFLLLSLFASRISPAGIAGDKMIFFVVLLVHVLLIFTISRRVAGSDWKTAILTFAAFFTAIHFDPFRFDDYHAFAQCLVLASFYFALRFLAGEVDPFRHALLQGALAALTFLTRVNEGVAIAGAVGLLMFARGGLSARTLSWIAASALSALVVFALVLLAVGETPAIWFSKTLIEASTAKGGGSLALSPLSAFVNAVRFLLPTAVNAKLAALLAFSTLLLLVALLRPRMSETALNRSGIFLGLAAFGLMLAGYVRDPVVTITALALVVSTVSFVALLAGLPRFLVGQRKHPPGTPLLLSAYPFFLFGMASLSTGGQFYGLYFPVVPGMFAAAMALRSAALNHRQALEAFFYTLLGLIALSAFDYRRANPFSWLDYHTSPLFGDYVAVQDPAHGPHLLPQEVHDLVSPVCREVGSGKDMLSLPYSFANYYCGIPLWHNVVQTFFDTSTAPQIERIMEGLNHDPPAYIFYQRQLPVVRQHEIIFNRGRPLVHRQLDQLIVTKVQSGDWKIVYRSDAFAPSHWYLIETGKRR